MLKHLSVTFFALLLLATSLSVRAEEGGAKAGKPIYFALEPPIVVNLQEGGRMRFMQVKLQVMTHDSDVINAIEEHMPPIRHAMIMLFAHQDAEQARSAQGREAMREQALAAIQEVLKEQTGKPGVEAVYFTGFVIQ